MRRVRAVLYTEWLKLRHYRPFQVLLVLQALVLASLVGMGVRTTQWVSNQPGVGAVADLQAPFRYPTVYHTVSYLASFWHILPALVLILHLTNEFAFRTHRQNLLDGWSRGEFLLSRLALQQALSLYTTALVALLAVLAAAYKGSSPSLDGITILGRFWLQSTAYSLLAGALALWLRRGVLAIGAFLLYTAGFEWIVAAVANGERAGSGWYLPLQAANALLPVPLTIPPGVTLNASLMPPPAPLMAWVTLAWCLGCVAVIVLRYTREDL